MPRFVFALLMVLALEACGGSDGPAPSATTTPAMQTQTLAPSPTVLTPDIPPATNISPPDGFSAYSIATGFFRPTSIALADDGAIFIAERHGIVKSLTDTDSDGVFESSTAFLEVPGEITGLFATPEGDVYVSATGSVILAQDRDRDGLADSSREIVSGLPHGRHQNNGLALGPDGKLYITNGSTCDDCAEADERSATILQANPDGSELRVFARGLRNPYDLVFDQNGRLWATDNGSDEPCATIDELNLITASVDYGWPYGADGCRTVAGEAEATASLGLHTASTGIASYDAEQFPLVYRGELFITLWGSFFATPELPPQVLTATIQERPSRPSATIKGFATGFLHPIDVVVDRDGTLLVLDYGEGGADDASGTLYRIVYTG